MKTEYELYLQTWNHLNPNAKEDYDFETIDFEPCLNYSDAAKQAKEISKRVPFKDAHGNEIVRVQVAAYYSGEEAEEKYGTSYHLIWKQTFKNGKGCIRYFL